MRAREFIVEYNRDITLQKLGDRFAAIVKSQQMNPEQAIEALENMDPSANKQYVPWLARQFMQGLFRLEDTNRIRTALQNYNQLKPRLQPDQRDINRLDIHTLEDIVDQALNVDITKSAPDTTTGTFPVVPNTQVLYNGPLGQLAIPQTKEASCELGRGTKWCTAGDQANRFEYYSSQAPLYVWRDRNGEKYQLYFGPEEIQIMNSRDRFVGVDRLKSFLEHPILKQIIIPGVQKAINSLSNGTNKAIDTPMFGFAWLTRTVLPELWDVVKKNKISPVVFYSLTPDSIARYPELKSIILNDPEIAAHWAKFKLKSRWPEAEPIIARNFKAAADYMMSFPDEFKNGWPEAEPAIAPVKTYAKEYARMFLNDPDPDTWGQRYIQSQRDRRRKQGLRQRLAMKSYQDMQRLGEAYEFIKEIDPIQIQMGPDISPEVRRYKERGTLDTFDPSEREYGAQDIIGPGRIRQMRAVQNVAPSFSYPKTGAMGSVYSPPKDDTTPTIPINIRRVTTFEPPEKAQANWTKVDRMSDAIKAGKELPPIAVKPTDTGYQVVDGHHRLAAHQKAGSTTIPAKVVEPENIKTINKQSFDWGYDQATKDFLRPGYKDKPAKNVKVPANLQPVAVTTDQSRTAIPPTKK